MNSGRQTPFGVASTEPRIIPTVEVNEHTDELVIRIPGQQLLALRHSSEGATAPRQRARNDANIVVLVEEAAMHHNYTWLCDLSRCDETIEEHQMLLMAIMAAMQADNSTHTDLSPGMLRAFGGTSVHAVSVHASLPCFVDCKVRICETN